MTAERAPAHPLPSVRSIPQGIGYRFGGRVMRLLPRLPTALTVPMLNKSHGMYRPKKLAPGHVWTEERIGDIPIIWIDRKQSRKGVLVYLHSGAYIGGPAPFEWKFLVALQERTSMAVAAVIYRKPPEHPFPAALDDAALAITTLQKSGELGSGRWIMVGASSGGGLALSALRRLADDGGEPPRGVILNAPWVDLAMNSPGISEAEKADGFLHRSWLGWAARQYAAGRPLDHPELSPIHGRLDDLPPVHLNVGTADLFLPDIRRLKAKLRDGGVPVEYIELDGAPHGYPLNVETYEAQDTIAVQASWARERLTV